MFGNWFIGFDHEHLSRKPKSFNYCSNKYFCCNTLNTMGISAKRNLYSNWSSNVWTKKIQWVGEWLIKLHSEFMCGNISRPFTPNYFTFSNEDYRRDLSISFVMLHTHLRYTRWLLEFTWFYESCVNLLIFQTEIPYPDQVHPWRVLKKYTKGLGSEGTGRILSIQPAIKHINL